MNSVKDGHCPKQIKRKNKQKKGRNEPQPPIASSSSRWYLPPKVKSMLQLGVETSVAAAPANFRLKPEPEPAPIRAEPSRIWSSRHFSRLPLTQLTAGLAGLLPAWACCAG